MNFTDIFIRRPVFATVLSLIIFLAGLRAYFSLPIRLYPKIDASVVTVSIYYAGADAALMESFVTTPIENALGGIDGIDYITSSSAAGQSDITIHFRLGYDINSAVSDVNSQVNAIRDILPKDIEAPVVTKNDPNTRPSIYLSFFSSTISVEQITDYLKRSIQPQLQTLPGVGTAQVWGVEYAMRIWLNPYLMAAYNITPTEIQNSLHHQNLQVPGGHLKTALQKLPVKTISELKTAAQFNNLVLRQSNGQLVKLHNVGKAEFSSRSLDFSVWLNGKVGAVIALTPSSIANPLNISAEIKKIFPTLTKSLPATIQAQIMWDSSKFITESIKEVKTTVIEATLCVIFVVFLFLGSWRTLIIPTVTIPLSLVGVTTIIFMLGYSLNTITLLALILAIGMVVDDAIVVAENIHRHIAAGKSPLAAALLGAKEIQFAIIAMTFTLAAVYAPIGFLTGLVGSLFKEFAFTLAGAVIISGFIALTLSPMMCSKIMLPYDAAEHGLAKKIDTIFTTITTYYTKLLRTTINHRNKILIIMVLILLGSGTLYFFIPRELAPAEDGGVILLPIIGPTAANITYTQKYTKMVEETLKQVPEQTNYLILNGIGFGGNSANVGMALLVLKPWGERTRSTNQIIATLLPKLWSIPGVLAFPLNPSSLPGAESLTPLQIEIKTLGDYYQLNAVAQKLLATAQTNPHLYNLRIEPKFDQPQLNITIKRDKAGSLGIPISTIGYAINLGLGEPTVSHFDIAGRSYDVIPQLEQTFSNQPNAINHLYLHTATGTLVPLGNLITLHESVTPQRYNHFQQLRTLEISGSMAPGYTLNQALNYFKTISKPIVPAEMSIDYAGQTRLFLQTGNQMALTFLFALIFIFLVLAAQFESFRDPFIVLFTIPLSIFGALLTMLLTKCTMNIYSEIGLVTLIGLISKHGILMVEFANQLQATTKTIKEAIITAATIRLRPILMTTAAMILGTLPLAYAHGAGAASRQQIGWVIIGGISIGTLFTLLVLPTIYTYLASTKTTNSK